MHDLPATTDLLTAIKSAKMATVAAILAERNSNGLWDGHLSSSALATAVAAIALHGVAEQQPCRDAVKQALTWLAENINADGGWGDTIDSPSNLSTTLLCWSALALAGLDNTIAHQAAAEGEAWIRKYGGETVPQKLAQTVLTAYGDDRTFSVPILAVCALTGRMGEDPWQHVPQLPFEFALLPNILFRFLRLTVVSYAIPALIALGIVRHRLGPAVGNILTAWVRNRCTGIVLRKLRKLQPTNGGFLEAAPLTAFVTAALIAAGFKEHIVVREGVDFLLATKRLDGSWPIDTNLSTWVSTLSINGLTSTPGANADMLSDVAKADLQRAVMKRQFKIRHPFTQAAPGGWGWSNLPGAVPDADDTSGSLLSIYYLGNRNHEARLAAYAGLRWLLALQNRDGGIPTFCRGWGRLPFDQSCPDITAHALRAFDLWYDDCDRMLRRRLDSAMLDAIHYLASSQRSDGSWVPLWFGNQLQSSKQNPVYGTAQVLRALALITPGRLPQRDFLLERGWSWLRKVQNRDGGWGGDFGIPTSIEETALALAALSTDCESVPNIIAGMQRLLELTDNGRNFHAQPIGLYFTRLWYAERMYPKVFTLMAFNEVLNGVLPSAL